MNSYKLVGLFAIYGILLLSGCQWDPDHVNPFDPVSDLYEPKGNLEIFVSDTISEPISRAEVRIDSLGLILLTNDEGVVRFTNLPVGEFMVMAERRETTGASFEADSILVDILENTTATDTFSLKAIPGVHNIIVQVLNLDRLPIVGARVTVDEKGWYSDTDEDGLVSFDNIQSGEWTIIAFKDNGGEAKYAKDTITVVTNVSPTVTAAMTLDALPYFERVSVNSLTIRTDPYDDATIQTRIRLKASVNDPDGENDIRRVIWRWQELSDTMDYNLNDDSLFFEDILSDDIFPVSIEEALSAPFHFEVYDKSEKSVQMDTTLIRIIHRFPSIDEAQSIQQPELNWRYIYGYDFGNDGGHLRFYYLVRIYRNDPQNNVIAYERAIVPSVIPDMSHTVEEPLEVGANYYWYVWVIDHFGNFSRSERHDINNIQSWPQ